MKKQVILNQIASAGVIAVVRGESKEAAVKAANALVLGGIVGLEITYTVPDASQAISELRAAYQDHDDIVIGAGTVLDAITARLAIMSGATSSLAQHLTKQPLKSVISIKSLIYRAV